MLTLIISNIMIIALLLTLLFVFLKQRTQSNTRAEFDRLSDLLHQLQHQTALEQADRHVKSLESIQDSLRKGRLEVNQHVGNALQDTTKQLTKRFDYLAELTEKRLQTISGQVEKRLSEGFEKTTATFTDIIKRLALIDEAQKKITELSGNVISLKELLNDKRSRGAFGEVQLSALIRNVLPEQHFAFQATLSNEKRADCILYLPEPSGNIVIDAKFPLENYRKITDHSLGEHDKKLAEQQFRADIKKHIQDIATKYIIPGETSDSAIMFIPAEAVFAEIHAHYPELIEASHRAKVWIASPTTMMAILTTVRAVIKDDATRKQVHTIQRQLSLLAKDFGRFQSRMDKLERHIKQANDDVVSVNVSAKKISSKFAKIEQVELLEDEDKDLDVLEAISEDDGI